MPSLKRMGSWAAVLAVLLAAPAWAEVRTGEQVFVGPDEVVRDNLYLFSGEIRIEGTVEGDVVAAGGTVQIAGPVKGDVLAFAGTTTIDAPVEGSVRVASGDANVAAPIGEDLVVAAGDLSLLPSASVGGEVLTAAGSADLAAPISGDVTAAAGELSVSGEVQQDVRARASVLNVGPSARVGGVLAATVEEANISPEASIGRLEARRIDRPFGAELLGFLFFWVRGVIGLTALGLLVGLLSPRFARALPQTLRTAPWKSLGIGAVALIGLPLAAGLVFVLGAAVGGWWIGLIVLAALGAAVALCFPAVGYALGQWLLEKTHARRRRRIVALVGGVALLTLALAIPVLGFLIGLATVLFGLGALLLTGLRLRRGGVEAPA